MLLADGNSPDLTAVCIYYPRMGKRGDGLTKMEPKDLLGTIFHFYDFILQRTHTLTFKNQVLILAEVIDIVQF